MSIEEYRKKCEKFAELIGNSDMHYVRLIHKGPTRALKAEDALEYIYKNRAFDVEFSYRPETHAREYTPDNIQPFVKPLAEHIGEVMDMEIPPELLDSPSVWRDLADVVNGLKCSRNPRVTLNLNDFPKGVLLTKENWEDYAEDMTVSQRYILLVSRVHAKLEASLWSVESELSDGSFCLSCVSGGAPFQDLLRYPLRDTCAEQSLTVLLDKE